MTAYDDLFEFGTEYPHTLPAEAVKELLDGHRAEVLAEDGQAFDGELAMLRGLVRTLRAAVRPDGADMDEVRRLLWEHQQDANAARSTNTTNRKDGAS